MLGFAEARTLYLQEIFDWTDSFNENLGGLTSSKEGRDAFNKLSELWVNYAKFEINLKQWKKAVQIFEDALNDSVVGRSAVVYVAYADFCKSRNKQSNALKVYFRGLLASLDDQDYDTIWIQLAEFMRHTTNEAPAFDELFSAVMSQVGQDIRRPSYSVIENINSAGRIPLNSDISSIAGVNGLKNSSNDVEHISVRADDPAPIIAGKGISSTLSAHTDGGKPDNGTMGCISEQAAPVPDNIEDCCDRLSMGEIHSAFSHRPTSIFTSPDKVFITYSLLFFLIVGA